MVFLSFLRGLERILVVPTLPCGWSCRLSWKDYFCADWILVALELVRKWLLIMYFGIRIDVVPVAKIKDVEQAFCSFRTCLRSWAAQVTSLSIDTRNKTLQIFGITIKIFIFAFVLKDHIDERIIIERVIIPNIVVINQN